MGSTPESALRIHKELATTFRTARYVWGLVGKRDKWVLVGAALVMVVVSASIAGYKLLLGRLVDLIPAMQGESVADVFYGKVGYYLVGIAVLFLIAEVLQVARNFVVR